MLWDGWLRGMTTATPYHHSGYRFPAEMIIPLSCMLSIKQARSGGDSPRGHLIPVRCSTSER